MPTEYTLEIAGEEYPWVDLRYVRDYKFYGKLIEAIIPEWIATIAGDHTIVIKRDGATVTSGKIKKIAPFGGVGKGMGMKVTGYTKEMKHATLLANALNYNDDPHNIIIDDIGNSDLTDGTTNLYGSNIVVAFGASDESKFSRKQVYEEVAFITGWELYVNPAGALDFKSQCGVDRGQTPTGTTVAFEHGELLEGWVQPHMYNYLMKKTKVIVIGAMEESFEFYGIAGTGDDVYTIERKNLIDDNTCSLSAAAVYADMQNALKAGAMNVINTYEGAAFDVYDTIYVADPRFDLGEDVRLYRIECHVDKNGEHTKIFYTNITKLTSNGRYLLGLDNDELDTGQRVIRDMGRTAVNVLARLDDGLPDDGVYRPINKYRGRADLFGFARTFRFDGEHEAGYTLVEDDTGTVTVSKNSFLLKCGAGIGTSPRAAIYVDADFADFSKEPYLSCRFKFNNISDPGNDRDFGLFLDDGAGGFSQVRVWGMTMKSRTFDGASPEEQTMGTISNETWYHVEVYHFGAAVYFYLDGVLKTKHVTRIPTGVVEPLEAVLLQNSAGALDFEALIEQYEVSQLW